LFQFGEAAVSRKRRNEETFPLGDDPLWYKDAIIYELPVKAFADSNGDGIGDFAGLIQKLDYVQDLGVTALWLLPFYPSPLRDDGYDIADYTDIHPSYGTLTDFRTFLREAHRRGLQVITELVINHTSDQHPWFQQAHRSPPGSSKRDFYVWSDSPEKYKETRIIFKDFEPSNWSWDAQANAYYWHRFYSHQPDLNYDNPAVHAAVLRVLDFWLNLGIDGLRLDAVPYLYEREGTSCENLPETHAFLRELRRHVDKKFRNRMLLAEANQWPEDAVAYFGEGDECHMAFHFPVMPRLFMAIRMEDRFPIIDILQQTPSIPDTSQWALFLRNHDELTLEMVTDEDRDYMYRVYAQDPQARINLGIRRRLAPLLENHRGKIELMNGLLLSLPGTPVLYYGDEIGMGDNIYLGDRNGVRTPMQWNADRNAGFSRANPQRLYLPVIIDPAYHFEAVNVEAQQNNPYSLLWWMKHLIALRKRFQAFGRGSLEFLYPHNHKVLAFVRRYQEEHILVVANLSRFIQAVELDLTPFKGMRPVEMLGRTKFPAISERPYFLTLGSYAFYWFTLEPQPVSKQPARAAADQLPVLEVGGRWENIFRGVAREALNELLPAYLQRCSWFRGKGRQTEAAMILEPIPFNGDLRASPAQSAQVGQAFQPDSPAGMPDLRRSEGESEPELQTKQSVAAQIALVQVEYSEGDSDTYLLPLTFAPDKQADQVRALLPQAAIARLHVKQPGSSPGDNAEGILYDPTGEKAFSEAILESMMRRRRFKRAGGELVAWPGPLLRRLRNAADPLPEPVLLNGRHANSSVVYGDRFILKICRHIEEGINPELEIGRVLADRASGVHVAPLAGALEYQRSWGQPMTLAILHGFVPNQGDAWRLTRDSVGRYFERVLTGEVQAQELPVPHKPILDLMDDGLPPPVPDLLGSYLEPVRLLGQRTAELHLALASFSDDPAFAPEPFTAMYQRSLYQSARTQARQAFELLGQRLKGFSDPVREDAQKLLGLEGELVKRAHSILEWKVTALRIRCHANYHLGEVLYTGKDFVIIDFEGDTTRPWSDRRRKRGALRDVATMLRSFHYAALSAMTKGNIRPDDVSALQPWVRFWNVWVSVTFVKAYLDAAAQAPFLPKTRSELAALLDFYLLKRAIQELRYDLDNFPERIHIPLQGLLPLLESKR
jgi:maltose alpha-D-glucosyltransferase/alpha-amylase